ncbi:hypothetical protein [Candidatus Frankia alpina]|uniref:hypothetical protein n=1 Tax=Candidatus Frankia alpina TaxID=2699483 RepID=UPI0013D2F9C5|nr:hypothetical protein [Candidatus Frankia alpina]
MPRPFPTRQSADKVAMNTVSGAVPVVIYVRHGTGNGCQSIAAQQEKALAFLATRATNVQICDPAGDTGGRFSARPARRRGIRRRRRHE